MITEESIKDILDADASRLAAGRLPLLTVKGKEVLEKLLCTLVPMPQADIDNIIRGTAFRNLNSTNHSGTHDRIEQHTIPQG